MKNPHQALKMNNGISNFNNKKERFRWQKISNYGESYDIDGGMGRKRESTTRDKSSHAIGSIDCKIFFKIRSFAKNRTTNKKFF